MNTYQWPNKRNQPRNAVGIYEIDDVTAMKVELATLRNQVANLSIKGSLLKFLLFMKMIMLGMLILLIGNIMIDFIIKCQMPIILTGGTIRIFHMLITKIFCRHL